MNKTLLPKPNQHMVNIFVNRLLAKNPGLIGKTVYAYMCLEDRDYRQARNLIKSIKEGGFKNETEKAILNRLERGFVHRLSEEHALAASSYSNMETPEKRYRHIMKAVKYLELEANALLGSDMRLDAASRLKQAKELLKKAQDIAKSGSDSKSEIYFDLLQSDFEHREKGVLDCAPA